MKASTYDLVPDNKWDKQEVGNYPKLPEILTCNSEVDNHSIQVKQV